jgi:F-type H+-transporting ATPase subunit delta
MKTSKEARKLSRQLFRASFRDGQFDEAAAREAVREFLERKSRHLAGVLEEYRRLVRLELQKRHALIESAKPLTPEMEDEVWRDLAVRYGAELVTDFRVNPDLIGGLRVKIGDDVWDGSVRGRLNRLEQELIES